jgi:anaerobic selenocysteine-containing dehydrogenase
MQLSRRKFLNNSAKSVVAGMALSAFSQVVRADDTASPAPPVPAVAPSGPTTTAPTAEGTALVGAATASADFALTDDESAEVMHQLGPYPTPVKDLRIYQLQNSDSPNMNVTASLRPPTKPLLDLKI